MFVLDFGGGGGGRVSTLYVGRMWVFFTLALCMQFVLARLVLMSPGCSQCGEEGGSVHGRRAGRQSRQSAGEPAGQRRYSDDYFTKSNQKSVIIKWDTAMQVQLDGYNI